MERSRPATRPTGARTPRVSVLITSYNYARFLPNAVASVLDRGGVDVDVLVIDDASSDDTEAVSEQLVRDPRVRVIRHEQNRGHIPSVNEGFDALEGEYLVKLDYSLTQRVSVRGQTGTTSGVGLFYRYAWD